jgi:hypothetical protein
MPAVTGVGVGAEPPPPHAVSKRPAMIAAQPDNVTRRTAIRPTTGYCGLSIANLLFCNPAERPYD